jgi:Tfp pilus assembly protein PilV
METFGMHGWGMTLIWVLVVLFLILGVLAFTKYLLKG